MSMTLGDMVKVASLNNALYSSGVTTATPASMALGAASQRISTQIDQTKVRLSSYGQIQSGFSSVQSTGKALTTLAPSASAGDITTATQNFVNAFNTANSAVSTATKGTGTTPGALANDQRARVAANDLRRITTSGIGTGELQKIGISVSDNGSMSLDTKAFASAMAANPNAVKSTLAQLGQQANAAATKELSSAGAVGGAVNTLNVQAKNLATKQTQQQNLVASQQAASEQTVSAITGSSGVSAGIAAYMKMFSV